MDSLEKQLADLQMAKDSLSPGRVKKIPPAVPPKKKAQPQVPRSAEVSAIREPSFSARLPTCGAPTYYNTVVTNIRSPTIDYVNANLPLPPRNRATHNLPLYSNNEESLPPPPPPPLDGYKYDVNKNQEEFLPPPSPVSSNYSELVRATGNINYHHDRPYPPIYQNEYPTYSGSQNSTYESIYEPINPRPQSNMSVRSTSTTPSYCHNVSGSRKPLAKEEEVDALTNLLVQSISDSQDLDVFGVCIKCGEKVIGESSGCTAMGHMYHIKCFSCHHCNTNLEGKPFYAVEGQPYCELDYYETLEKCSVCDEPILDRILRATGKPYHPTCFTCVVCGKSLDGIPFTVDAMNQIHCIEDFHKKFAPRCCVCELPIMPEDGQEETVRVVALDRSFHVRCYCCEDCGMLLTSEADGRGCYPLDDHILCKNCNAHRIRMLTNVMTTDL